MSEVKVNKITPTANCGTVTLGDSGDTFSLPAGVTLSNAGSITNSGTITNTGTISGGTITGTIDNQVNWDTTAKTAGFTAVAGNGYFVNTTSGAITVTLPATPTAGDLVGIKDYANTADTNNITIDRNGSNIQGVANNFTISVAGTSITLIYVDGTQGWVSTGVAKASDITEQARFVSATGGCVLTCGDYKTHVFTGPGTFCVSCAGNPLGSISVEYMVVAGGGGGGIYGGGGGAGGYRQNYPSPTATGLPVTATGYPITVGAGGASNQPACNSGIKGSDSIFSSITSAGGGGGSGYSMPNSSPPTPSNYNGGSGGGGATDTPTTGLSSRAGGSGNTPPVSPPQGNPGGTGYYTPRRAGGGGGGAGAAGTNGNPCGPAGPGGDGLPIADSFFGPTAPSYGTPGPSPGRYFAGGGGGYLQAIAQPQFVPGSVGGAGGGGNGGILSNPAYPASPGTVNTGGGGGGFSSGGSGIVVIRYKYQ